jgi:hypothetical protein
MQRQRGTEPADGHGRDANSVTKGRRTHKPSSQDPDIASEPDAKARFLLTLEAETERPRWFRARAALDTFRLRPRSTAEAKLLRAGKLVVPQRVLRLGEPVVVVANLYSKRYLYGATEILAVHHMNCRGQQTTERLYTVLVKYLTSRKKLIERELAIPAQHVGIYPGDDVTDPQ